MRQYKQYNFNDLAGCVSQTKSRITKTLVGLYQSEQSGMESDPELPWTTVCEVHHTCVSHSSLAAAKQAVADPTMWCEDCQVNQKNAEALYKDNKETT